MILPPFCPVAAPPEIARDLASSGVPASNWRICFKVRTWVRAITIRSMIDALRRRAAHQPPNRLAPTMSKARS